MSKDKPPSSHETISYMPTGGLSYDPSEEIYWDEEALHGEMVRTFEICHGCRLCFKYCDSFPSLFDLLDNSYDGDVLQVTEKDTEKIMGECFQCKLCDVQCPYTVREGHEYMLDFPKLVHRYRAQEARDEGFPFRERFFSNPDRIGKMGRLSLTTINFFNRIPVYRLMLQFVLGINRKAKLPRVSLRTFERWAKKNGYIDKYNIPNGEVALFQTCYVQNNFPKIGQSSISVLEANQVKTQCVAGLKCCGMPAWEIGDIDALMKNAERNIDRLKPYVEEGMKILVINPTCAMMMRREYPELVSPELKEDAQALANAVAEPAEFLWSIRKEERFNTDFKSTPRSGIGYQAACHLRSQSIGFRGRDLLKKIPETNVSMVMECSGHGGVWGMKKDGYKTAERIGKKAIDGLASTPNVDLFVSDCPLAVLQFQTHSKIECLHTMEALAKAYKEDGFSHPVDHSQE